MSFIEANGAKFFVETTGEGDPLILISGYASDHTSWATVVPALSEHFKVVTFDNRGVGQTTDNGRALSAELMADDVMAISDALGLEKPHIAGLSMGGNIAQAVGIKYSDRIGKLICLATAAKWRTCVTMGIRGMIGMNKDECSLDTSLDVVLGWIFGEQFLSNPDNIEFMRQIWMNNPFPQSIENQERQHGALEAFNSNGKLGQITVPTLIGFGREDMVSFESESQHLVDNIPNATLVGFDCAHVIMAEAPEALTKVMLDFLN